MKTVGCVNIFGSKGACVDAIVFEMESRGEKIAIDAVKYLKLDSVNPGEWSKWQFTQ
jgi:pyrophosphate--fructose-6-phosphate 1-phosphotransferase